MFRELPWFKELETQLLAVTAEEIFAEMEKRKEVRPREEVLGDLPESLICLIVLRTKAIAELQNITAEHDAAHKGGVHSPESCKRTLAQIRSLSAQIEALDEMFWAATRTLFPTDKQTTGIRREGAKMVVVTLDSNPLEEMLEGPLGELVALTALQEAVRRTGGSKTRPPE